MTLADVQAHQEKVRRWREWPNLHTEPSKPGPKPRKDKGGPFAYEPAKVVAGVLSVALPLRLVSTLNTREHFLERAKRAKAHREMVCQAIPRKDRPNLPVVVTLTRIGRKTLDTDNLAACMKAARDGVADAYGFDDGWDGYTWEYRQELGESFGLRVEIVSTATERGST